MAAGGFKEFVAGETLDEDDINDYLMQGVLVFAGTAARASAIPSPVEGQFSFRTDDDVTEFYDGSDWVALGPAVGTATEYVVVAGGGGGGARGAAGGGAGGYRSNVAGESSGGGASAEASLPFTTGTFTVTVGAGGAAPPFPSTGALGGNGSSSVFSTVSCTGGGSGGSFSGLNGQAGGSGGGGCFGTSFGAGTSGEGFAGGPVTTENGGGGGAAEAGNTNGVGHGGDGVTTAITVFPQTFAGGGGGMKSTGTPSPGGAGGGGQGAVRNGAAGVSGLPNTGGGGGAGDTNDNRVGGAGGSGVVILRLPSTATVTKGASHTMTSFTANGSTTYVFTAGDDSITIA